MEQWDLEIDGERFYAVGDIINLSDGNFKVTKVTRSALAVERYYWFNAAFDWIVRRIETWREK